MKRRTLDYTNIQNVFFISHLIGHCFTNVIRGHSYAKMCANYDL